MRLRARLKKQRRILRFGIGDVGGVTGAIPLPPPDFQISASLLQEISVVIIVVLIVLVGIRPSFRYDIALRVC